MIKIFALRYVCFYSNEFLQVSCSADGENLKSILKVNMLNFAYFSKFKKVKPMRWMMMVSKLSKVFERFVDASIYIDSLCVCVDLTLPFPRLLLSMLGQTL